MQHAASVVWSGPADLDLMPAWGPPTPPAGDGDVYRESWARALYRPGAAPEALLPAPRAHTRARPSPRARHPPRQPHAPLSLFERGASAGAQARSARARPALPPPASAHQPTEWTAAEDAALRRALRLQRLPPAPPPALAPNWEWVAELVAEPARAYRSPRACRDRHEALQDPERARRRRARHAAPRRRQDRDPLQRLEAVRLAAERRRAKPRRRLEDAPPRNLKHAQVLVDLGLDPDAPPTPMEVAERRADRIAREKLKASAPPAVAAPPPTPAAATVSAAPPPPPRLVVAASPAPLLYRQQAFPARHLKILHQAPTPHPQSAPPLEPGALRKLQLQQLALRRAGSAASSAAAPPPPAPAPAPAAAPPHVLVAHLAPSRPPDSRQ